jgi:hypothetical protein
MKRFLIALLIAGAPAAIAQTPTAPAKPSVSAPAPAAPAAATPAAPEATPAEAAPVQPVGGTILILRGLDKITGRPTNIVAPIGKPVKFATLTITARYCYSTPPSETPETSAFVQIDDHRPDQPEQSQKRVFSGWMYASSPGLNAMEHPLYDVWALRCNSNAPATAPVVASTAPVKVASPDASDKETVPVIPPEAGK